MKVSVKITTEFFMLSQNFDRYFVLLQLFSYYTYSHDSTCETRDTTNHWALADAQSKPNLLNWNQTRQNLLLAIVT